MMFKNFDPESMALSILSKHIEAYLNATDDTPANSEEALEWATSECANILSNEVKNKKINLVQIYQVMRVLAPMLWEASKEN